MGLLLGSDQVIAARNTYWIILNIFIASIAFIYFFIFYLFGFVSMLGDAVIPGVIWKIPATLAVLLGNAFAVTMNYGILLPLLVLHGICVVVAIIESYILGVSLVGCLTGTLMVPCSTMDQTLLIVLGVITVIFDLSLLYCMLALVDYTRGFNRIMQFMASESAAEDYQEQMDAEEDL